ncbi:MAG: hypothetical protein H0V97_12640, partial [Actinobacteria bacterium]|nr:hypothetical protein [Actinomycetota bacterium]
APDDESAARSLLRFYKGVAVTGRNGCTVATSSTVHFEPAATRARVVDATGAGDAFAAGFLAVRLRTGMLPVSVSDLPVLARAGLDLAARALSTPGARPPLPRRHSD